MQYDDDDEGVEPTSPLEPTSPMAPAEQAAQHAEPDAVPRPDYVSEGAMPVVETIAKEELLFPAPDQTFATLREQAKDMFDARDMEQWLDIQLDPHAVEMGDLSMQRDVKTMVDENEQRDREKLMHRAEELGDRIEEARDHITSYFTIGKDMETEVQWRLREEEVAARERVVLEYQAKEARLLNQLKRKYGELQRIPKDPFSWTVEWDKAPQEFSVNVTSLRGLRGKVRDGYYVLLFSVVDRVGGKILRFSSGEANRDCSAAIPPLKIKCKSSIIDRYVNRTVDLLCPAPSQLGTNVVMMVELWKLRVGKYDPTDKVVGFGYWPLVNQQLRVTEGKFKLPMLLGEADPSVDTYRQIGGLVEDGLQYWLGNLYFEIKSLARLREKGAEKATVNEFDMLGSAVTIDGNKLRLDKTADDIRSLTFPSLPPRLFFDDVKVSANDDGGEEISLHEQTDVRDINKNLWEKRALLETEKINAQAEVIKRKTRALAMEVNDDEEVLEVRMRGELGASGQTRRQQKNVIVADGDVANKNRDSHVLLQHHHFALASQREFFFLGRRWRDIIRIAWSVVKHDVGINHGGPWNKPNTVVNLVFFLLGMYGRMIVHSVAKYLYLASLDVPLTTEKWDFYYIDLRFKHTSRFYPIHTLGCIAMGFAATIGFFAFLSMALFLLLLIFHKIPYFMTRFMFWFGFAVLLDPLIVSISDAIAGNMDSGEPFLLYNQFDREEKTGVHGAILTGVLYVGMDIPHFFIWGLFTIFVHLNGRAFDIYQRLTYPESSFFIPHDLEIGTQDLKEIVKRAKIYRSDQHEHKRVTVNDFNHKFICLFRERMFKLLSIMSNDPEEWVGEYFERIAVRRPPQAKSLIKHGMGSFEVGSDCLTYMSRNFPHLCGFSRHRVGDIDEDLYYENDLIRGVTTHSTQMEDELEMREFLKAYFRSQVSTGKPAEWSQDDHDVFHVKDTQLLADLIFFETSGSAFRLFLLIRHLRKYIDHYLLIDPDEEESWGTVHMPDFDRDEPAKSIEGDDANGVVTLVTLENPVTRQKELKRTFVVTPFGQIIEPTQSSFTYKTTHTADYPEFWAAKAMILGRELDARFREETVSYTWGQNK